MNYIEVLPFDLQELIGKKLHNLYMKDLDEEIYEASLEYEWRKTDGMGDDFNDSDWELDDDENESEDSYYSFVSSE